MSAIVALIVSILQAFLPVIGQASKDTAQDSATNTQQSNALKNKLRETWGKVGKTGMILLCFTLSGCFTRTIYIPPGEPVRLREKLDSVKVWVLDSEGKPVAGKMDIPEGWYTLPMPDE